MLPAAAQMGLYDMLSMVMAVCSPVCKEEFSQPYPGRKFLFWE